MTCKCVFFKSIIDLCCFARNSCVGDHVALPPSSYEPRPAQVSDLRCTMRGATWLDLQWRTCDPEGAPVKECCVEVRWMDGRELPDPKRACEAVGVHSCPCQFISSEDNF